MCQDPGALPLRNGRTIYQHMLFTVEFSKNQFPSVLGPCTNAGPERFELPRLTLEISMLAVTSWPYMQLSRQKKPPHPFPGLNGFSLRTLLPFAPMEILLILGAGVPGAGARLS